MKTPLAFLAIFSLLLLCSTADGRKYPEKYWGKGRNLRMLEEGDGLLDTSSEPVGSGSGGGGGGGGGDPKEEEPIGTSSEPVGSGGGGGGGGDPKEAKPRRTFSDGGGAGDVDHGRYDPKIKKTLLFSYRGPQIPVN